MEVIELVAPATCESVCKKIQTFPCKNALSLPIYEPRSYIDPDNRHPYDDKTKKIFYNVSRYQAVEDPEVKDFLRYLENTPHKRFYEETGSNGGRAENHRDGFF